MFSIYNWTIKRSRKIAGSGDCNMEPEIISNDSMLFSAGFLATPLPSLLLLQRLSLPLLSKFSLFYTANKLTTSTSSCSDQPLHTIMDFFLHTIDSDVMILDAVLSSTQKDGD